jgi:hypothetical protein
MLRVRYCVELLLISVLYNAFSKCDSVSSIVYEFQHFDELKQLGTLLAIFVIVSGGCDLIRSLVHRLHGLFKKAEKNGVAVRRRRKAKGDGLIEPPAPATPRAVSRPGLGTAHAAPEALASAAGASPLSRNL